MGWKNLIDGVILVCLLLSSIDSNIPFYSAFARCCKCADSTIVHIVQNPDYAIPDEMCDKIGMVLDVNHEWMDAYQGIMFSDKKRCGHRYLPEESIDF